MPPMPPMPPITLEYCKNCGIQLQNINMKFCPNCGSQVAWTNFQGNASNAISDMSVVKAKLKIPSIALIISAGISFVWCFIFLIYVTAMIPKDQGEYAVQKVMPILSILQFSAFGLSIYGAFQMMSLRKYGFAITSAIIIILSPIWSLSCLLVLIGPPIGIWGLIVLLNPKIKSAFARNSMAR